MASVSRHAMLAGRSRCGFVAFLASAAAVLVGCSSALSQAPIPDAQQPANTVKLVFIHHSCGENWLADSHGGLGEALAKSNYFVSDTNYGWGPNGIGDRTDITDWPEWFTGPQSDEYLQALYRESEQHCEYTRSAVDPGGDNDIVMIKSCFPNSNLAGQPTDAAARGEGLSVANARAIYNELLTYFASRPDKLFVVCTAPPVQDDTYAANARALNKWLVQDWLANYRGSNVAVFDFYNVLTGPNNHHRLRDGKVEYICNRSGNTLYYPSDGDDHPSAAGNRKATEEFVPLLNAYYNTWAATKPKQAPAKTQRKNKPARDMAVETPPPDGTPPAAEPAVATISGQVIDDFEREPIAWQTFLDGAQETRLSLTRDTRQKHAGAASLHVRFAVATEGWATCSYVSDRPQDWSRFAGVSFHLHVAKANQNVTLVAYGGKSSDELLHFEHQFQASQTAVDGWEQIEVLWSQFKPAAWQGDETRTYDAHSAMGLALGFGSTEGQRNSGDLWIDDVTLISPQSAREPPTKNTSR